MSDIHKNIVFYVGYWYVITKLETQKYMKYIAASQQTRATSDRSCAQTRQYTWCNSKNSIWSNFFGPILILDPLAGGWPTAFSLSPLLSFESFLLLLLVRGSPSSTHPSEKMAESSMLYFAGAGVNVTCGPKGGQDGILSQGGWGLVPVAPP